LHVSLLHIITAPACIGLCRMGGGVNYLSHCHKHDSKILCREHVLLLCMRSCTKWVSLVVM